MATIEERAIALQETLPCDEPKSLVYLAYKKGAEDQRKIDVNNALTFLRQYGEGDFSCWEEFESVFRKAMMEK